MFILLITVAYLVVGYLFHLIILPERKPDISKWFQPGQQFYSAAEGVLQTVVRQEGGFVYCSATFAPFAPGPPKHIHTGFAEVFEVENGELTVWVDGTIHKIGPGDPLCISPGVPHKPYNESPERIRIKGTVAFPERFAFYLVQVYGVMDTTQCFRHPGKALLQMAMLNANGFDSYLTRGPVFFKKASAFMLVPLARLLGYKSYYKQFDSILTTPKSSSL